MQVNGMIRRTRLCLPFAWHLTLLSFALLLPLVFLLPLSAEIREFRGANSGIAPTQAEEPHQQAIIVVTVWESEPPSHDLVRCYESELGELMAGLGMRTRFVGLSDATQNSFAGRIVVLRMTESANEARKAIPGIPTTALAWTHASGGDVTPFGAVDLAALSTFLQLGSYELGSPHGARVFGRALGRVAAHEIFHMITRSMVHSPRGVMQAELTRRELTSVQGLEWMPRDREMAMASFPQAHVDAVVAAVQRKSDTRVQ